MEGSNDNIVQKQYAGSDSNQYQISNYIVNQGISEERVRSIFAELIPQALESYTQDAYKIASSRIDKLETTVIPRIMDIDGAIAMFADPAFQVLLRKAQQSAAATERDDDYGLLSELLVCHIQKGNDRKNRAGISKAIEIVDDIDNDALCALTLVHAVGTFIPVTGDMKQGLQMLNALFAKLFYMQVPEGTEWIEHLDVLGAVRIDKTSSFKKTKDYYIERLSGYTCVGLKKDSKEYTEAMNLLNDAKLSPDLLIPNELLEGYVRLPIPNQNSIKKMNMISLGITRKINDQEIEALNKIWKLYLSDENLKNSVVEKFNDLWNSYSALKRLRLWWDNISMCFYITKVGKVLAHTNAKRCDPELPDLL